MDKEIIRDADRICNHIFDLLGSGDIELGPSLPWHEDFKTGFRWENKFYKWIKIVDLDNAADVKVPWELSRFQHFFTLGKAYWLTNDEKYAYEFRSEIEDWIMRNPVEMSINWTCAMDVAIRAVNWISVIPFFMHSPSIPKFFWENLHASLYLHGVFVRANLENTGEHTGNHYTANLAGLVALGLYFEGFRILQGQSSGSDPAEWLAFGKEQLEKEMFVQSNEDGSNYEASTSYHRLVAEMFMVTTMWCSRNGLHFSDGFIKRLEKMHEFMLRIMKPDGSTPMIGDADDGRYLIVSHYGNWVRNDFRHLLAIAGEFFDRDDFRSAGLCCWEDALWMTGGFKPVSVQMHDDRTSVAFPDGGYYVLRSPEAYCLIRCGELSFHGHGAHSHNDQLSFELNVKGLDFIVDPGTCVYSGDYHLRNLFRSTAMHNTLRIGGREQNDFDEKELFLMREQTFAVCEGFTDHEFTGKHQGYLGKLGITHKRNYKLHGSVMQIDDLLLDASGMEVRKHFTAAFMLAAGVRPVRREKGWLLQHEDVTVTLLLDDTVKSEIQLSWLSNQYGVRTSTRMLVVTGFNSSLRTTIRWD
ncbi:heparinase II/III family protein [Paenibacillus chibensis]|uniref:heparinase II/III family protein n=1 Tax=Paenibacillus chibensis TaxID=59846 RepID=UPI0013E2F08A|nr:alginate lyase family protein [Paenibacillus chibensis]MEC0369195.1 alginate lyase family protein [Paenibacillus chibensis]